MLELNHEKFWKRLLAAMQLGVYLQGRDGHIWIECDGDSDDYSLSSILDDSGVMLNNKIYGGILEALDTIDEALKMAGVAYTLLELYDEQTQFLGNGGVDGSRLDKTSRGKGGIY